MERFAVDADTRPHLLVARLALSRCRIGWRARPSLCRWDRGRHRHAGTRVRAHRIAARTARHPRLRAVRRAFDGLHARSPGNVGGRDPQPRRRAARSGAGRVRYWQPNLAGAGDERHRAARAAGRVDLAACQGTVRQARRDPRLRWPGAGGRRRGLDVAQVAARGKGGGSGGRRGVVAARLRRGALVCGDGARHRAHHVGRSRRIPQSGTRAEQYGNPRRIGTAGLVVPDRVHRARHPPSGAGVRRDQLRRRSVAERLAAGQCARRVHPGAVRCGGAVARGANAVAVRISPPPHPGIAHEESIRAGAGFNGGMQALDEPTFFASEGWDWIPGIRDATSACGRACGWRTATRCASAIRRS